MPDVSRLFATSWVALLLASGCGAEAQPDVQPPPAAPQQSAADRSFQSLSLPIGRGPLRPRQYMFGQSRRLEVRVRPKEFFCGRVPADRRREVADFYSAVLKRARSRGVRRFSLTVSQVLPRLSAEPSPVFARTSGGRVELTSRGLAKGPCP